MQKKRSEYSIIYAHDRKKILDLYNLLYLNCNNKKVGSTAACTQNLSTHASTYFHFFASIYAECKVAIPLRYAALFMVP